jgi:hypothetical protein
MKVVIFGASGMIGSGALLAYMFRPAFIQPLKGVRTKTRLYRVYDAIAAPLYPALRRLFSRLVTTSQNLGRAMIRMAAGGYSSGILETEDINRVAGAA